MPAPIREHYMNCGFSLSGMSRVTDSTTYRRDGSQPSIVHPGPERVLDNSWTILVSMPSCRTVLAMLAMTLSALLSAGTPLQR
jgi:hypothetical protein